MLISIYTKKFETTQAGKRFLQHLWEVSYFPELNCSYLLYYKTTYEKLTFLSQMCLTSLMPSMSLVLVKDAIWVLFIVYLAEGWNFDNVKIVFDRQLKNYWFVLDLYLSIFQSLFFSEWTRHRCAVSVQVNQYCWKEIFPLHIGIRFTLTSDTWIWYSL